ncbi:twin-arginine translocation signal domain-containing protein [Boseaceae bacterium BT-24-1]|nr:twin-arginine translocation signal domain-containing protein [Boseaceae bacterium BT-24-1]
MTTRRDFLIGSAVLAAGGLASLPAQAQGIAIGGIRVDARRLGPQGWGENAPRIARAMEQELARQLAPLRQRGGPTLYVTVQGLWLTGSAGTGGAGDAGDNDNMDSLAEVIDRGRVLFSRDVRSHLLSSSGGAWYRPDVDQYRVTALLENNAQWIKRYLGA